MSEAVPWIASTMFLAGVIVGFLGCWHMIGTLGGGDDDGCA